MQGRIELMDVGGGDKVQIENTASELRKLGVEVDIATKVIKDLSKYDLVHIFQLDWTPETYFYAREAHKQHKPIVLSPIHHSLKEVKEYDSKYAYGFRRVSRLLFKDQHHRDTFKNVYRALFDTRKLFPTLYSVFKGLKNMHISALKFSNVVLVQTEAEAKDLISTYGVNIKWEKVHNGVSDSFLTLNNLQNIVGETDYIVCVGRIEPRKNNLSIIEAVKELRNETKKDIKLVFVGTKSTKKHMEYIYLFDKALHENSWIKYLGKVDYSLMPSIYKYAKVSVSASWFETTGLTSLEALFCETNAVAAGERAREYLQDLVSYCDPSSIGSIKKALKNEYFADRPKVSSQMKKNYTWKTAAQETFEVYNSLVKGQLK